MGYCQLNEGTGKKLQVNFTMKDLRYICYYFYTLKLVILSLILELIQTVSMCSDISINYTLWEDYAGKFLKFNNERKEFGPVVVMLTYAKLKEEGLFSCSNLSYLNDSDSYLPLCL